MRPLEHRWDRSRGIVFSAHNKRRTYASKPIQRSTPTPKPATAPTKGFGPQSAASAADSAWKGGLFPSSGSSVYSVKQGNDLEKKNRDLHEDIQGLHARIKEHKTRAEMHENQVSTLRNRITELDNKLGAAKSQAQRDLRVQKAEYERELSTVSEKGAGNQWYMDRFRQEVQVPLYEQINRLNAAQTKDRDELISLKTAMEEQKKKHETTQRNTIAHSRDLGISLDKAKKEISSFRSRKQEDREDYTRYHAIFADLNDKIFQARDEIHHTRRRIEEERSAWSKSHVRFKTSENLRLFLHSSKYAGTKSAIEDFLKVQVAHANSTLEGMRQLEQQLVRDRVDMQPIAHESRALTRHHQLDEHQGAYNSVHLAQRLATTVPFQALRKEYTEDIENLTSLIEEASRKRDNGEVVNNLKGEMQELVDSRRKVQRFLTFFAYVQDWRALQALRDDDIVEKAVWVDTNKAKRALDSAVERFYEEIEDSPFRNAGEWERRNHHRDDVRTQRVEFDLLVAQVRQRHLLAHDLGKMSKKDIFRVEQTIKRQTELAKSSVNGSLAGLGFQKPAARRRASIQSLQQASSEDVNNATAAATATIDGTPAKPVPTIDTLRASLLTKVSTKKQRVVAAEKKPVVLKKLARKPLASRKQKKLFPASKRISVNPSTEKSKPSSVNSSTDDKAKVKAAGSGLKPTKPMQAQYTRPAYETEGTTSKAGNRAPRGGSMGFSTLKDALARTFATDAGLNPTAAEIETENTMDPPTAAVDGIENTKSEDSTTTFKDSTSEAPSEAKAKVPEEPQTVLSYQIPPKDFRDAAMASPNSNAAYWSHNLYKNPENQKPVVYYCQSYDAAESKAQLFLNEKVLGFDMEWEVGSSTKSDNPNIKRAVSLIQIAAEDKIGLFQIARFRNAKTAEEHMPPSLRKILESKEIVKAGVNISGDATRLKKCLNVEMRGIFELSHLFRVVKESKKWPVNFRLVSLGMQVQEILMLPLKKDDVRVSAWSKELNLQQTGYAAADAYAGLRLFWRLEELRRGMRPKPPPRPGFYEEWGPLVLGDGRMVLRSTGASGGGGKKTIVRKGDEVVVEEGEEGEEEFFDAPEGLDTYELGEPEISGSIPNPEDSELEEVLEQSAARRLDSGSISLQEEISYPTLPKLEPDTESGVDTTFAVPAPSRTTTTLPLRSKLTSKRPSAQPQPSQSTSPLIEHQSQFQSSRSLPPGETRPGPLPCPEIQSAETWLITHRSEFPTLSPQLLLAYHLWHYQQMSVKEVARFCRDPPLEMRTVASYILQVLEGGEGKLAYDRERVREVLGVLPVSVGAAYLAADGS